MKIDQLIKELQEVQEQYGNVEVVTDNDIGYCEIRVKDCDGEFDLVKQYQDINGDWQEDRSNTPDEELEDIKSVDSIKLMLVI